MAQVHVRKTTIKKKNSNSQKKLYLRRVAVTNSVNKLTSAARH
jgi:hypothetical protein